MTLTSCKTQPRLWVSKVNMESSNSWGKLLREGRLLWEEQSLWEKDAKSLCKPWSPMVSLMAASCSISDFHKTSSWEGWGGGEGERLWEAWELIYKLGLRKVFITPWNRGVCLPMPAFHHHHYHSARIGASFSVAAQEPWRNRCIQPPGSVDAASLQPHAGLPSRTQVEMQGTVLQCVKSKKKKARSSHGAGEE